MEVYLNMKLLWNCCHLELTTSASFKWILIVILICSFLHLSILLSSLLLDFKACVFMIWNALFPSWCGREWKMRWQNKIKWFFSSHKGIHCMSHHTNLIVQTLSHLDFVFRMKSLLQSLYMFFSHSPKRHIKFTKLIQLLHTIGFFYK